MQFAFESISNYVERYLEERAARHEPTDSLTMTERYVLSLHREVDELLDEIPWKDHRFKEDTRVVRDNLLEEVTDIIFFAMSVAKVWGASYAEVEEAAKTKLAVLENRWREDHDQGTAIGPKGIALIDLDGVLCDYDREWWAGLDSLTRKQRKHEYRISGAKRHLDPIPENVAATRQLARAGYDIVVLTKRPRHLYHRIEGDTMFWLAANGVPARKVIFTEDKAVRVALWNWRTSIAFAVDDDPDNVDQLRDLGIKTYQIKDPLFSVWGPDDVTSMERIPEVISAYGIETNQFLAGDKVTGGLGERTGAPGNNGA